MLSPDFNNNPEHKAKHLVLLLSHHSQLKTALCQHDKGGCCIRTGDESGRGVKVNNQSSGSRVTARDDNQMHFLR